MNMHFIYIKTISGNNHIINFSDIYGIILEIVLAYNR